MSRLVLRKSRDLLGATALLAGVATGCKSSEPTTRASRSDAVPQSAARETVVTSATKESEPASSPEKSKPLCDPLEPEGESVDLAQLDTKAAPGVAEPSDPLFAKDGRWTWVNLWAAWCVPCKAEIPHLLQWKRQLGEDARLQFVSFDDDARQLDAFLAGQADDGLTATYWATEGEQRSAWLASMGFDEEPQLPSHILLDGQGRRRCVVNGVVEASEWPRVKALLSQR